MKKFSYTIKKRSKKSDARLGVVSTAHGELQTPAFVTVATNAVVKGAVDSQDLKAINTEVVLGNTYHLFVRDQVAQVKKAGGLGKYMNWDGPTFTDSGGFQVFSLGQRLKDGVGKFANYDLPKEQQVKKPRKKLVTVTEQGVTFRSHLNGQALSMTPEDSMQIQSDLGADMIFTFDEPTSPMASHSETKKSMELTHRWAVRSVKAHKKYQQRKNVPTKQQVLFGIVQGGPYEDLRQESAEFIARLDFPGFGIGGSYHRTKNAKRFKELDAVIPALPEEKPRHFLGIGGIEDILIAVKQGIDTFDCVIPTREARHGRLYMRVRPGFNKGFYRVVNITNAKFKSDHKPVNNSSLKMYSRAYLYHLFKAQEMLGVRLATLNNIEFYLSLMSDIRQAIKKGDF